MLLVCFDHSYRLQGDSDLSGRTAMTSTADVDAYGWVNDWQGLLAEDDAQLCFSIEYVFLSFSFALADQPQHL